MNNGFRPFSGYGGGERPTWRSDDVGGDVIRIEDLAIHAFHGVLPEEKRLGQRFLLTIDMALDLKPAGRSDDLTRSVSYAEVAQSVTNLFSSQVWDLIETGAETVARHILVHWPLVRRVRVCVKKPWAPIGLPLETVSVTVERAWHIPIRARFPGIGGAPCPEGILLPSHNACGVCGSANVP